MLHFRSRKDFAPSSSFRARPLLPFSVALLCLVFVSSILVACGSTTAQSTSTSGNASTPTSTPSPTPTPTFTPTPKPKPKPTPIPPTPAPQGAPAILDLQPASMSIVGHLDCKSTTVYVCQARVISRSSNQSNLHWSAFTNVPGNISFSPVSGVLAPGQSVIVTIFVPFKACTRGLFFFKGPINTHTITWAC